MSEHYTVLKPFVEALYFHDTILEIGVSDGAHWNRIAPLFTKRVAIDIAPVGEYLCDGTEFYQMTSDDFFAHVAPRILTDISYCFIDGDHRKEYVLRDVENALRYCKPYSSLIALHDFYPPNEAMINGGCWDAWEVALELRKRSDIEFIVAPLTCMGIGLCRYTPHSHKSMHWQP